MANKLLPNQRIQAVLEVPQEDLAAFAGKQFKDIILVFLQMLQQMTEHRTRRAAVGVQTMCVGAVHCAVDDVPEKFFA